MTSVVELKDVTVRRGDAVLLDGISWRIAEGERWVVIGPNGAGKTTLMQVLAAQLHPTSGSVGLLGEQLGAVDVFELRPRIGVASADLAERIPRSEKVSDVVISSAYGVLGRWNETYDGADYQQAAALMGQLGVAHLADRTFGTLSEGERKRVQIARALMTDPELLLLDEPAAGLDLAGREYLVATLGQLAQDLTAPTTVMVTHHVEEIPAGITHAILLKSGKIVTAGPIKETITGRWLSETFDIPLRLYHAGGRYTARLRPER